MPDDLGAGQPGEFVGMVTRDALVRSPRLMRNTLDMGASTVLSSLLSSASDTYRAPTAERLACPLKRGDAHSRLRWERGVRDVRNILRVSADPVAKAAAHTRAESRDFRHTKVDAGERRTFRWRGMDSNFRFRVPCKCGLRR